jgi:hypothetical protein
MAADLRRLSEQQPHQQRHQLQQRKTLRAKLLVFGAGAARQSLHFGEQFHIPEVGPILTVHAT